MPRPIRSIVVCALALAASGLAPCALRTAASDVQEPPLSAEYDELREQFAVALGDWRPARPATGSLLFVAPDQYTLDQSTSAEAVGALRDARRDYARRLFKLAQRAADAGRLSLAMQWVTETLREDPDHAQARRVLGYELHDDVWLSPYGLRMADNGKRWHARFGWIAPEDLARYESGERPLGSRWISAEDDARRHASIESGWQVRTDHFLVTTSHSLEAGAELAARLERLHQVWRQLFAGFYLTENEVTRLLAGERAPRRQVRPFRVYYHRNYEEYVAALQRRQPRIADTLGIYFDTHREAHFFASAAAVEVNAGEPQPAVATLYHEAVHQLFQESQPAARRIAREANFWIVEGVATYFETLTEHVDPRAGLYYTVGEVRAGRIPAARERLENGFYLPLAQLTRLGKQDLQQHPELAKVYSQSAGLAAFLMDGAGGRFREAMVRYLQAVYAGHDDALSLAEMTGEPYEKLDALYRQSVESLP